MEAIMIAQFRHSLAKGWVSLVGSGRERSPALTAGAQSKLSWATRVDSYEEAPLVYRAFLDRLLANETEFPHAVLTPTFRGYMREEKEKLVCVTRKDVYIVEQVKEGLAVTRFAGEDIHYVEMGAVLLHAWLTIRGRTDKGVLTSSTLKFNAVTGFLFAPILAVVRRTDPTPTSMDLNAEKAKFRYLRDINFKFMNYGRRTIAPGEKVIKTVLQPEIKTEILRILGRSLSRTVTTAHLTILTDKELIVIRDDEEDQATQDVHYGGIWTYIPLAMIQSASLTARNEETLRLRLHLPEHDQVDFLFSAANRQDVQALIDEIALLQEDKS
jgi:hypothetical protein